MNTVRQSQQQQPQKKMESEDDRQLRLALEASKRDYELEQQRAKQNQSRMEIEKPSKPAAMEEPAVSARAPPVSKKTPVVSVVVKQQKSSDDSEISAESDDGFQVKGTPARGKSAKPSQSQQPAKQSLSASKEPPSVHKQIF